MRRCKQEFKAALSVRTFCNTEARYVSVDACVVDHDIGALKSSQTQTQASGSLASQAATSEDAANTAEEMKRTQGCRRRNGEIHKNGISRPASAASEQ